MAYYQRQGLLFRVPLASSLLSTLWEKTRIRPHRCAILQFMQFMGKKVAAMYCCSQLCITSRENIVCVILIKKIIILLIRTYCLIENVTFTCYSLCSWWCRFSFLCSVRNHFCTNDRFKVYIFEDTWQSCFISPTRLCIDSVEGLLYCSIIPYPPYLSFFRIRCIGIIFILANPFLKFSL